MNSSRFISKKGVLGQEEVSQKTTGAVLRRWAELSSRLTSQLADQADVTAP